MFAQQVSVLRKLVVRHGDSMIRSDRKMRIIVLQRGAKFASPRRLSNVTCLKSMEFMEDGQYPSERVEPIAALHVVSPLS